MANTLLSRANASRYSRSSKKSEFVTRLIHYKKLIMYLTIASLLIMALANLIDINIRHDPISDEYKISDLYAIEVALVAYSNESKDLPASLDALKIHKLSGDLGDYNYRRLDSEGNITTRSYEICAAFHVSGGELYAGTIGGTPEAYKYHRKGSQCYNNSIYKGSSHVSPVIHQE